MDEQLFSVKVSDWHLKRLRMLADWQLRELGFDPASVTKACQEEDEERDRQRGKPLIDIL